MMKIKRIIAFIMIITILSGFVPQIVVATDESNRILEHNEEILNKVKKLQEYAVEYKESNKVSVSATNLCLQYIRNGFYGNTTVKQSTVITNQENVTDKSAAAWAIFAGDIDSDFIEFVEAKNDKPIFKDENGVRDVLLDSNTGKEIDFIHMIATLNTYLVNNNETETAKVNFFLTVDTGISTHYAGWAGDLMILLEQVTKYREDNTIVDMDTLQEYANSMLGTNKKGSTCSNSDMLANLDSLALYKDTNNSIETDLHGALCKYYITNESTYNSNNRLETAKTILGGTMESVKQKARELLEKNAFTISAAMQSKTIYLKSMLFENPALVAEIDEADYEAVSQSFANYIFGIPYMELTEYEKTVTLTEEGQQEKINVKIIESNSNLTNENIIVEKADIAEAIIEGENLVITPKKGGKTKITVTAGENQLDFNLTVYDIAPYIKTHLSETYKVIANTPTQITFDAGGTNNVYTWCIGDSEEGEFVELERTTENTYNFTPTLEMDGKYIMCKITNNSYENIIVGTNASKLNVYATQNELEDSIYITEGRNLKSITLNDGTTALIGLSPKTKVSDFMSQGNFALYSSGIEGATNDIIGTNSKIKLFEGEEVIKEYTIIIYGDTNGDAEINAIDALGIVKNKNGKVPFKSEAFVEAGKIKTKEGVPGAVDALAIIKYKQDSTKYPIEQYK